jgi:hypothetical protein
MIAWQARRGYAVAQEPQGILGSHIPKGGFAAPNDAKSAVG